MKLYAPGFYTPHFSVREMQASETAARYGLLNDVPALLVPNMIRTCQMLETVRARFGPIRVTSGYRSPRLNALIGGSATSAHMDARAVDFEPLDPQVTLKEVVLWIMEHGNKLDFDQCIFEYGQWIHLGIAAGDKRPRREALMIFGGGGYKPFNPADPRVSA